MGRQREKEVKERPACMMYVGSTLRQIGPLRQKDLWIKESVIEPCVCGCLAVISKIGARSGFNNNNTSQFDLTKKKNVSACVSPHVCIYNSTPAYKW